MHIPHTILRNGIYWLNIRWADSYLRLTLRTREPDLALTLVGPGKANLMADAL